MFGAIKDAFQDLGREVSGDVKKISVAAVDNDLVDPGRKFGCLWEASENVENCRGCQMTFQQLIKRKHHCRCCAGVFCDKCCAQTQPEDSRYCYYCKRGETPGDLIKNGIRELLDAENGESGTKLVDKFQMKVAAKVGEALNVARNTLKPSVSIQLQRGKLYPEDGKDCDTLPNAGYFEFINKSQVVCCLKLLYGGGDVKFEIPRPSYIAIAPGDYVHALFEPNTDQLDMMILFDNPFPLPLDSALTWDTTSGPYELLSACAQVRNFPKVTAFTIKCKAKNILLKYKGADAVVPRHGDGLLRVGLIARLQGQRFAKNILDYSTNIAEGNIRVSMTYAAPI